MTQPQVQDLGDKVAFVVKVVPGSSRTAIAGVLEGMVKVKVAAPPEKGKANECLIEFLARLLKIRKNDIAIVSGHTSPVKHVQIQSLTKERLLDLIGIKK